MSYWISLLKAPDGDFVGPVECFQEGGTQAIGGTTDPELNVTYNYSEVYRLLDFHLRDLDGKRAGDTFERMQRVADKLGDTPYADYWAPTPGNAGVVLKRLLAWARQYPDGIWSVR